jgi:hypothetical protein
VIPSRAVLHEPSSAANRHRSSRLLRAAVALSLAAAVLLPAGASFAQSPEEKAAARSLAMQGADALNGGRFADALDLVSRAEAIVHAPTHLLMIARAQVGTGKLVAAHETLLKLTHEDLAPSAPPAFKKAQADGRDDLTAIEPKIASLRIILDGATQKATVKLDDLPVPAALLNVFRPVDPGHHVVTVFAVGLAPVKAPLDLHEGEKREIKLTVPDGPPPPGVPVSSTDNPDAGKPGGAPPARDSGSPGFMTPLRGAGIGLAVVGVAGIAVGAVFLSKVGSAESAANAAAMRAGCTGPGLDVCPTSAAAILNPLDATTAHDKTIGGVAVGIGAAALVTGAVLIAIGKPRQAAAQGSLTPWFSGTAGGVAGQF